MILGEPILLGGKGETASIFVTGLTENDTVTASKDGKTWNGVWTSKVIQGVITYGHLISNLNSYGTYTVTAERSGTTISESVLVDMATEYEIPMSFNVLYDSGWENEALTGGWGLDGFVWEGTTVYAGTKNDSTMQCTNSAMYQGRFLCMKNSVDITNYSTLKLNVIASSHSGTYGGCSIEGATTKVNPYNDSNYVALSNPSTGVQSIDISSKSGNYYFYLKAQNQSASITVSKIWLE